MLSAVTLEREEDSFDTTGKHQLIMRDNWWKFKKKNSQMKIRQNYNYYSKST